MQNSFLMLEERCKEFTSHAKNVACTNLEGAAIQTEKAIESIASHLIKKRNEGKAFYFIGNGGSAGVAAHAVTDCLNVCKLRAHTLHDPSLITCMANDYGYENAFARIIRTIMQPEDTLVAISSSGNSRNICNAAAAAKEMHGAVITFTGFDAQNPLRKLGDYNLWLNSSDYGIVEIAHAFILHNITDRIYFAEKFVKYNNTSKSALLENAGEVIP